MFEENKKLEFINSFSNNEIDLTFKKTFVEDGNLRLGKLSVYDTLGLAYFWSNFKISLIKSDTNHLIQCIDFPIHAYHIVIFNFGYSCDTNKFISEELVYKDVNIIESNLKVYYSFLFNSELKEIIGIISYSDLIENSIINLENKSLNYIIFPREYNNNPYCNNDEQLNLLITFRNNSFKIRIFGL